MSADEDRTDTDFLNRLPFAATVSERLIRFRFLIVLQFVRVIAVVLGTRRVCWVSRVSRVSGVSGMGRMFVVRASCIVGVSVGIVAILAVIVFGDVLGPLRNDESSFLNVDILRVGDLDRDGDAKKEKRMSRASVFYEPIFENYFKKF